MKLFNPLNLALASETQLIKRLAKLAQNAHDQEKFNLKMLGQIFEIDDMLKLKSL